MSGHRRVANLSILAISATTLLAQATTSGQERPKYNPVFRERENWSTFLAPAEGGDLFDPIKHISLIQDDWLWVSFGGQVRLRLEAWEDFSTFENDDADETFLLTRVRAHADIHAGEHLRFFFEGLGAHSTEPMFRADGVLDVNSADLQQAFFDLKLPFAQDSSLRLRGGRQELAFGKQRLVSALDWSNTRRTWEGVRGTLNVGHWAVDGLWTQFVPVEKYEFDTADAQHEFYGLYAAGPFWPLAGTNLDAYWLGRDRKDVVGGVGDLRHTLGSRLSGQIAHTGLDYDLEGGYQFGDRAAVGVEAYFAAAEVGYTFAAAYGKPRFFAGVDYATGDDNTGDDEFNTFDQLFPLGHAYFGFIDIIGRPNMLAYNAGVSFTPVAKWTVLVQGHWFDRAQDDAPLFNAGGSPIAGKAGEHHVGQEIDLLLKYQHDIHTQVLVGYSHFFVGDYFDLPGHDDIDFFYVSWEYTF